LAEGLVIIPRLAVTEPALFKEAFMKLLKYSAAVVALGIFASPALADCKFRLSQIENVIGPAATGTASPTAQAAETTKGTTAEGATGAIAGGQPSGVEGSKATQSGAAPQTSDTSAATGTSTVGSSKMESTTATASTGSTAGKASGVDAKQGTQAGPAPSTSAPSSTSSTSTMTPSKGSIDMASAKMHLDKARAALDSGNESDCMKAADEAAKAAGLSK